MFYTNKLILGTVQFGLDYGINNSSGKINEDEAFCILDAALENGVSQLDTAAAYGDSEQVLGKYFTQRGQDKFKITTKFSFANNMSLYDSLQLSLDKLCINHIDTLLFHSCKDYLIFKDDLSEFSLKNKNKYFSKIGVSVYTNEEIELVLNDDKIELIQAPFNLLDNSTKRQDAFELLKKKGKSIQTRSAFLQGLFFKSIDKIPSILNPLKEPLKKINYLCNKYGYSINAMALLYSLQNNLVNGVLMGVDSYNQLITNLNEIKNDLPIELIEEINAIKVSDENLLNPSTWKISK